MKTFLLASALLLVAWVPACDRSTRRTQYPTSGSITFGHERIGSGTELIRSEEAYFEGRARVGVRRIKVAFQTEKTRHEQFLAVKNGKPTYLAVTYPRARTRTTTRIDGSSTESEPVENETYRVWRGSSKRFRRGDGSKPSIEESLELLKDYTLASHPIEKLDTMRGQTIGFGEEFSSGELAVLDFQDPRVTVRLVEEATRGGRPAAIFEVWMEGDEAEARYELEGIAIFDIRTAALLELTVEGPMTYREPGAKVRGTVRLNVTHDYRF